MTMMRSPNLAEAPMGRRGPSYARGHGEVRMMTRILAFGEAVGRTKAARERRPTDASFNRKGCVRELRFNGGI